LWGRQLKRPVGELIMLVSVLVPKKLLGRKRCDEDEGGEEGKEEEQKQQQ